MITNDLYSVPTYDHTPRPTAAGEMLVGIWTLDDSSTLYRVGLQVGQDPGCYRPLETYPPASVGRPVGSFTQKIFVFSNKSRASL